MRLLLDTHAFLWLDSEPEKLSLIARSACEDPANELCLSVVSAWEIQIKKQLGRLHLEVALEEIIKTQQENNGLLLIPVEIEHIYALDKLPLLHNDPFDRLLLAQAYAQQAAMISVDSRFKQYPVNIIW